MEPIRFKSNAFSRLLINWHCKVNEISKQSVVIVHCNAFYLNS